MLQYLKKSFVYIILLLMLTGNTFAQQTVFVPISDGSLLKKTGTTCDWTSVGSTSPSIFGDIAITPNGRLWGISSDTLYEIDTTNANLTAIGNVGLNSVALVDLDDTTLLAVENQSLIGIRTTNSSTYIIGNIGYSAAGDLCWYDNDLYMTSGDLIRIKLSNNNTAINSVSVVNQSINPIISHCYGIVTSSFVSSINYLVGIAWDGSIYKICPFTGASQLMCTGTSSLTMMGCASMRLGIQVPAPIACQEIISVNEYHEDLNHLIIYPCPVIESLNLKINFEIQDGEFTLVNSLGQEVHLQKVIKGVNEIKTSNLAPGLYNYILLDKKKIIGKGKLTVD